ESLPIAERGPASEELTIDVALFPLDASAPSALVVTSGLHGIEGYVGSALQTALLEQGSSLRAPNVRLILMHALNPWGFAYRRRVDADHVTLNRNFLLHGESYSGAPSVYQSLDRLLNPRHAPSMWEPFLLKALWATMRHGASNVKQAIACGQYEFPMGLYFGG